MTSRATGMRPTSRKTYADRDFRAVDSWGTRKAVCRRCHLPMTDTEPFAPNGLFYHVAKPHQTRAKKCPNEGRHFGTEDAEIEPFMRKRLRRSLRRAGVTP